METSGNVLTEQTFDETLATADGLLLVDFWAPWCGPCRVVGPVLEALTGESDGRVALAKVNVDEQPALAARFEVLSIPTILFVKDGRIVDRVVGALPKATLAAKVQSALAA
ncbi:MAG: thioredoxin [Candidatus Rokuibacteriota bacterium]|nr:MAG: thioredoxin [Candidatus Rokubacteria bacterium]